MTFSSAKPSIRAISFFWLVITLGACSSEPLGPEAEVRAWIEEAEGFAEDKKLRALAGLIDADYSDARGNDRQTLVRQLRLYGFTEGAREVLIGVDSLEIVGESLADVALSVRFANVGGSGGRFNAGSYQVKLELRRSTDGDWTLFNARWARAGEALR